MSSHFVVYINTFFSVYIFQDGSQHQKSEFLKLKIVLLIYALKI